MRGIVLGCLCAAAAAGCGGSSSAPPAAARPPIPPITIALKPPPDYTLTAEELAKEYDADPKAYADKYAGRPVEVSGTVMAVRETAGDKANDVMLVGQPKAKSFLAQAVVVTPAAAERAKYQGLKALAKGQSVTVRGTAQKNSPLLADAEFVKAGPSTAVPVAPSALAAAFGSADKAKYVGKAVVVRGEVAKAEWNNTVATLTLVDPGTKSGGKPLEASVNPNDKAVGEAIGKIAPGTVVIVIGEADELNGGRVWEVRVLTAPPEGVTLPGAK